MTIQEKFESIYRKCHIITCDNCPLDGERCRKIFDEENATSNEINEAYKLMKKVVVKYE